MSESIIKSTKSLVNLRYPTGEEKIPVSDTEFIKVSQVMSIEKVVVSIGSNQVSDGTFLRDQVVTFTVGGEKVGDYTWTGEPMIFGCPVGKTYVISFSELTDYRKPANIEHVAEGNRERTVDATYETEVVSVVLSCNANNLPVTSGQTITIGTEQAAYTGTAVSKRIPYGQSYTVSATSKSLCKTPAPVTHTAGAVSRSINLQYLTEKVTVSVNVSGVTITINGRGFPLNGGSATHYVAYGTNYNISASGLTNYKTPSTISRVAQANTYTPSMTYVLDRVEEYTYSGINISPLWIPAEGGSFERSLLVIKYLNVYQGGELISSTEVARYTDFIITGIRDDYDLGANVYIKNNGLNSVSIYAEKLSENITNYLIKERITIMCNTDHDVYHQHIEVIQDRARYETEEIYDYVIPSEIYFPKGGGTIVTNLGTGGNRYKKTYRNGKPYTEELLGKFTLKILEYPNSVYSASLDNEGIDDEGVILTVSCNGDIHASYSSILLGLDEYTLINIDHDEDGYVEDDFDFVRRIDLWP